MTYDEVKKLIDSLRQDSATARGALMEIADKVREIGAGPAINPETLNLDIANMQDAINELADLLDKSLGSRAEYVAGRHQYSREVARG
jgi:hypothetical protein